MVPEQRRPVIRVRWLGRFGMCVLAWLATNSAHAADPVPTVNVPAGIPVALDGFVGTAEWADAKAVVLGDNVATLRMKQHRGTLLLAIEMDRAWVRGTHLMLNACADLPECNAFAPGAVSIDWEPLEHNRPHLMVRRVAATGAQAGMEDLVGSAIVRARVHGRAPAIEMALRLPLLGLTNRDGSPRRMAVALPRALESGTPTWPAGLDVGASVGKPPEDIASSKRWGRLTGFADAEGPGALSKSDWDALLAEDQAITERGARAHAKALEIIEEGGHKLEKEDAVVEREVLEPLAWIGEREPLSPYDVLVRSQVLRHLNRHEEALAAFDAMALVREPEYRWNVVYERAITLEARERFEESAVAWERLAEISPPGDRSKYLGAATRMRAQAKEHQVEQLARAADALDPDLPLVLMESTRGPVLIRLHAEDVPEAVKHFLKLVATPTKDGTGFFYDGTLFHRVVGSGFVQGGDPRTRTEGCDAELSGPASTTIAVETNPRHGFWRGAVCFARAAKLENACQFFVMTAPRPEMAAQKYTVFGHVVTGMDAVDRLERCDTLVSLRRIAPPAPPAPPTPDSQGPR
jgi:cyclophilin family peptidyl-prolyl cis-trans isomerase